MSTSNLTGNPIDDRKYGWVVFQSTVVAMFSLIAITGNSLVLSSIIKYRTLRSFTSVFIGNLAVVDFMVGITLMPFALISCITWDWIFDQKFCQLCGFVNLLLPLASILTLVAIAFDRYIAIVKSLHYHEWITKKTVCLFIGWIWGQSFLFSMCPLLGWGAYAYSYSQSLCIVKWEEDQSFAIVGLVFCFVLPFVAMIFCYCRIFIVAREHNKKVRMQEAVGKRLSRQEAQRKSTKVSFVHNNISTESRPSHRIVVALHATAAEAKTFRTEKKASIILLIVLGTFIIAWMPYIIGIIHLTFAQDENQWPEKYHTASVWIAMLQSSCNPVIYGIMDRRYRHAMYNILCCMKAKRTVDVTGLY
ncbi:G-protein coupled receptor 161-like [Amphiura filiformis]|uniref:G-protein coupled receptor 161-like n=1 Tax=Amphiura filiformis TaxID=82378 RepID=UPI003B210D1E